MVIFVVDAIPKVAVRFAKSAIRCKLKQIDGRAERNRVCSWRLKKL